jgi:phosphoglycolate phosphatase
MTAICFDLDGTLTDPRLGITRCLRHALRALRGTAPEADTLTWCIGPPLLASLQTLLGDRRDAEAALAIYRERFGAVGMYENELYAGVPEVLAALAAAGHRLFVATSKPTVYARPIIEHFGLDRFFDDICGSELDGTRTDKTELLAWLLARNRIDRATAAMIGDRSHDMVGARNNAMRAIGVAYGYGGESELRQAGAEVVCAAPWDIETLFA